MNEPLPPAAAGPNLPVLTVSEIAGAIRRTLEDSFGRIRVRGEISGLRRPGSGHVYMDLKDADSLIATVCWRGVAGRLSVRPEDGMEVIVTGRVTTFGPQSRYQLIVEDLELAGEGALLKLIEERRRRLASEGLFDEAAKAPLPFLPGVIGVVTSPTGAVIRDILHRLEDRFPRHVLLWPVRVQGREAPAEIAAAIDGFNALPPGGTVPRPDLLIVARGGGSLDDLMAFNEEIVVRAAARSAIPLISAVGHETDVTLIDFAADRRAPTPTAAAEMAVPVRLDLASRVRESGTRMGQAMLRRLDTDATHLDRLWRIAGDPRRLVEESAQRLDGQGERLGFALGRYLESLGRRLGEASAGLRPRALAMALDHGRERLAALSRGLGRETARRLDDAETRLARAARLLAGLSYQGVLERGFVLVRDGREGRGTPLLRAAATRSGQAVSLIFADRSVTAVIDGASPAPSGPRPPARTSPPSRRSSGDDDQGRLL